MTKSTSFAVILLSLTATTPAFAHAGDHHHVDLAAFLTHLASSPSHALGLVLAGILLAALCVIKGRLRQ